MFNECINLENIIFNFNTEMVNEMTGMFKNCKKIKNLNLKSFDTSNVETMDRMFYGCENLSNIDLSFLKTHNVRIF